MWCSPFVALTDSAASAAHRGGSDLADDRTLLLAAKNRARRVEFQHFCRLVARMDCHMDHLPALATLQSGLMVHLANQLDYLQDGIEAQVELRERQLRKQLEQRAAELRTELGTCGHSHDATHLDDLLAGYAPAAICHLCAVGTKHSAAEARGSQTC